MAENFITRFFGFINRIIDPPEDDEEEVENMGTENPIQNPVKPVSKIQEPTSKKPNKPIHMQINMGKGDLNVHLVKDIKYPKSATEAVDKIKNNMIVVFNFEDTDQDISQKTIDFISGAAYAIGGDVQMITEYVVLFLPMSGKFSQEQKKKFEDSGFSSF